MKILVIQQKMIGDVLVSSILCDNLRKAYPKAQIDYMVYESTIAVLQGNTSFDNLILFQEKHQNSKWEYFKLLKSIRAEKYDIVIDAYSKLESWLVVLFSGAKQKISYWKKGRDFLYTDTVKRKKTSNTNLGLIIEQRLALLNPLHLDIELETFPRIYVTQEENNFAASLFESHGIDQSKKTIMVSIIGSSPDKTYPLQYMSKLIDFIADKGDVNILFNYFPKQIEEAKTIYDGCKESTKQKIYFSVLGKSIREFIAIMNQCNIIIGNDGGAINMAKALEKPSLIIFSPWIDKKGWATFEDGINHVSLHLKEFKPNLFEGKTPKIVKKETVSFYTEFTPELIYPALNTFLETHLK
ncbi:glycosyltransferase family 9 protein [Flavobacterium xinjiangense]|uniref:Heptosyltransferase-2 n=1 Tax=Flavobacterium xinjiangense TaxID=178356 RepID=A0A1M7IM63_9FLAO|nr:glycosyltransferase family 9 protein [Flavobacterium xinjiangense]SHM41820.1 heptosyltransferase-2 [Flavobacterium xinjiangense]